MIAMFSFYGGASILILRVIFGAIVIVHGWPKLKDIKKNAEGFQGMGFKPGWLFGTIAALLEFFGGIGLVIGFLVVPLAILFTLEFLTITIWKIVKGAPFRNGWEFDFILLAAAIVLLALGSGSFAIDRVLFHPWL